METQHHPDTEGFQHRPTVKQVKLLTSPFADVAGLNNMHNTHAS